MKKKTVSTMVATLAAGLFIAGSALANEPTTDTAKKEAESIHCKGINQCKGHGACHSEGGNTCAGKNECKGKGWVKVATEKECTDKGGTVTK